MTPRRIVSDLALVTWRMVVPALLGAGVGYGLDRFLGTRAVFFLVFSAVGLIIGGKSALALTNAMPTPKEKERKTFDDDHRRRRTPRKFDS
jgi:F0F1-type ATP synthase assembly protein I